MVILAIDTSAGLALGLVNASTGEGIGEYLNPDNRSHAELLSAQIENLLRAHNKTLADLALIAVGTGPAPFTGLRVGLVSAQTLGFALGVEVRGVCSLAALAHRVFSVSEMPENDLIVSTDARRKELYWAHYNRELQEIHPPSVGNASEVANYAVEAKTKVYGAANQLYGQEFAAAGASLGSVLALQSGISLGQVAFLQEKHGVENSLLPLYLRGPDAKVPTTRKQALQA